MLIESMHIPAHAKVLDLGCGYGPIGICAALLAFEGHVTMVDINQRAVELAKENAGLNLIHNVSIVQSDLFEAVRDKKFDVIITNPPIHRGKPFVHSIFTQAAERLCAGGSFWIVMNKKQGAPSALVKLESLFSKVTEVNKGNGFRVYRASAEN